MFDIVGLLHWRAIQQQHTSYITTLDAQIVAVKETYSRLLDKYEVLQTANACINDTLYAKDTALVDNNKLLEDYAKKSALRDASSSRLADLNTRKDFVLSALLEEDSPLYDRPYILYGVYTWKYVGYPVGIDILFPDTPFAICVSEAYAPYDVFHNTSPDPSRKFWEEEVARCSSIAEACRRAGIPLLLVGPNDPIDSPSLCLQVRSILDAKKV